MAVDPGRLVRTTSRNLRDITRSHPELRLLAGLVDVPVLLDVELVALDEYGRPGVRRLVSRLHVQAPTALLVWTTPVLFYVFGLLYQGGSLPTVPYLERRELLAG